jgi:hypothetical protein
LTITFPDVGLGEVDVALAATELVGPAGDLVVDDGPQPSRALRGRHVEDGVLGARLDASLDLPQRARFGHRTER